MIHLLEKAQALLLHIEALERQGELQAVTDLYVELAAVHEEVAQSRRMAGDPRAWIDAFAAITCEARAGRYERAYTLLRQWKAVADEMRAGAAVLTELDRLQTWLVERAREH